MKTFRVVTLKIPFFECLRDAAEILCLGLIEAGYKAHRTEVGLGFLSDPDSLVQDIVLGVHGAPKVRLGRAIIYNTEHPSTWSDAYTAAFLGRRFFSYTDALPAPLGGGTSCPLGYVKVLDIGAPLDPRGGKHDVLFIGSPCARRTAILNGLRARGLKVITATPDNPSFGRERDLLIDASKVVLNVHYYTNPPLFASSRVVPALHRGACVVSEVCEGPAFGAQVPYEEIVDTVEHLCRNDSARAAVTAASLKEFRKHPMSETLKGIL